MRLLVIFAILFPMLNTSSNAEEPIMFCINDSTGRLKIRTKPKCPDKYSIFSSKNGYLFCKKNKGKGYYYLKGKVCPNKYSEVPIIGNFKNSGNKECRRKWGRCWLLGEDGLPNLANPCPPSLQHYCTDGIREDQF